jgi:type III secretory pathway lipoprotein EscJ
MNEREDAQSIERRSRVEIMRHKEINDALSIARRLLLGLLFCAALAGCKEEILHGLSEWEANRVLTRLHFVQIQAEKVSEPDGRWAIAVPSESMIAAMQQLEATRVLRARANAEDSAPSFLSSRELNRFHHERLLSREIEQSVLSMPGILDVRVHINLPESDALVLKTRKAEDGAASALLIAAPDAVIQEAQIANLVSGASGISAQAVHVVVQRDHDAGRLAFQGPVQAAPSAPAFALGASFNLAYLGLGGLLVSLGAAAVLFGRRRSKAEPAIQQG